MLPLPDQATCLLGDVREPTRAYDPLSTVATQIRRVRHPYGWRREHGATKARVTERYTYLDPTEPSTADASRLDPTLRRCRAFAFGWGYAGMRVINLFAWRSIDPRGLRQAVDPVGPDNDAVLSAAGASGELMVAGWGAHGGLFHRAAAALPLLGPNVRCLGLTRCAQPRHPLYLPRGTELRPLAGAPGRDEIPTSTGASR